MSDLSPTKNMYDYNKDGKLSLWEREEYEKELFTGKDSTDEFLDFLTGKNNNINNANNNDFSNKGFYSEKLDEGLDNNKFPYRRFNSEVNKVNINNKINIDDTKRIDIEKDRDSYITNHNKKLEILILIISIIILIIISIFMIINEK